MIYIKCVGKHFELYILFIKIQFKFSLIFKLVKLKELLRELLFGNFYEVYLF